MDYNCREFREMHTIHTAHSFCNQISWKTVCISYKNFFLFYFIFSFLLPKLHIQFHFIIHFIEKYINIDLICIYIHYTIIYKYIIPYRRICIRYNVLVNKSNQYRINERGNWFRCSIFVLSQNVSVY